MTEARTHYKDAVEHFAAGHTEAAIEGYRRALEINENLSMAWNGLAMALARIGDLEAALDAARRYADLEPDEPLAHTSLSMLYQRLGRIAEAEDEKALSMRLQMAQQN